MSAKRDWKVIERKEGKKGGRWESGGVARGAPCPIGWPLNQGGTAPELRTEIIHSLQAEGRVNFT